MNHADGNWSLSRGRDPPDANIIVNLSLVLRGTDTWAEALEREPTSYRDVGVFRYYLWSSNGIEEIKLP